MSWTTIEQPQKKSHAVRPDAIRIFPRKVRSSGYIEIAVGKDIAQQLGLVEDAQQIRLMLGSNNDAGKLAIVADRGGSHVAKRKRDFSLRITIGASVAREIGLTLDFEPFERTRCEVLKPTNGQPRMTIVTLSADMLEDGH